MAAQFPKIRSASWSSPFPSIMEAGGAAHAHQGGKGGDGHNERQGDSHPGEGAGADAGDVADVHAVHHVVKQVDELGQDGGQGQLEEQAADVISPQISPLGVG